MASHTSSLSESVSLAKLSLYGTIGAAVIGAVTTVAVGYYENNRPPDIDARSAESDYTHEAGPESTFSFGMDGDVVSFSGPAAPGVNGMFILVGPKPEGGFWPGYGLVADDRWQVDVPITPPFKNYEVTFIPQFDSSQTGVRPVDFRLGAQEPGPSTWAPSPQDQIMECAAQYGPVCFQDPRFGAPSVYQPVM
jgi:hypothetical protein